MPSSFSPNLRIELIGAGEQAGTWGSTTNTNLGTLIEQAISGAAVVNVSSANQALTALNGAADQSRNAVLVLTTSTTANFAIYAPPEPKLYTVSNTTAYTATIYSSTSLGNTTAAGTGVAIPAGRTLSVWSDGTDFTLQNTYFDGVVAAQAGSTATTQAFGNSSTLMATTAFVQAALQALHPVGSIYINATNATNPATLFGFGTWTAFGAGRVPVGFNAADPLFDSAEETGGSKNSILVSHTHTITNTSLSGSVGGNIWNRGRNNLGRSGVFSGSTQTDVAAGGGDNAHSIVTINFDGTHGHAASTEGSSGTNANLQPYITVYMWKRTA
jgi:hypothetical protein